MTMYAEIKEIMGVCENIAKNMTKNGNDVFTILAKCCDIVECYGYKDGTIAFNSIMDSIEGSVVEWCK